MSTHHATRITNRGASGKGLSGRNAEEWRSHRPTWATSQALPFQQVSVSFGGSAPEPEDQRVINAKRVLGVE